MPAGRDGVLAGRDASSLVLLLLLLLMMGKASREGLRLGLRRSRRTPYRCSLPGLTRFGVPRRTGPEPFTRRFPIDRWYVAARREATAIIGSAGRDRPRMRRRFATTPFCPAVDIG